jgi:AmmeMemoRadiSam system protein B
MIRKPIVAGRFYEADPEKLREQIKECFVKGPGLPDNTNNKEVKGIIAPHAGFIFSGKAAAYSYKEIAESDKPDLYIVLGLSHHGFNSCTTLQDFETPLGIAKNDKEFTEALIKNGLEENKDSHLQEHSLEVQLPFLQFVQEDFKFCPIIVSEDYERVSSTISKILHETGRNAVIIASSDLTHYGISYEYVPFTENVKENMYKQDKEAIEFIKKLDPKGFLKYINKTGATICGKYPISCLLELVHGKVRLLDYYTSGDILKDYSNAVGYGSIVVE